MPNVAILLAGAIDGNPFQHTFTFTLPALEYDVTKQAMEAEHASLQPDGSLRWEWGASQNVPLNIPVKLPLGIKETLHEVVALAETVIVTLAGSAESAAPAIAYPVTRP